MMNEPINECMNESVNEEMNEMMNKDECLNLVKMKLIKIAHECGHVCDCSLLWMNGWMNKWINEWMNEWMNV